MNRSADALIVATELRHRRGSLATLGLLVAVVTGAAATVAAIGSEKYAGNLYEFGVFYTGPEVAGFRAAMGKTDVKEADWTQNAVHTWLSLQMTEKVLAKMTKANATRADFVAALQTIKGEDLGGQIAPVDYTKQTNGGHFQQDCWTEQTIANGKLTHMGADGKPLAMHVQIALDSIAVATGELELKQGVDSMAVDGIATAVAYDRFPAWYCGQALKNTHVPAAYWRSVGGSHNGFFMESFMDELAFHAGADPLEFRRSLTGRKDVLGVIDTLQKNSDWGKPLPKGRGRGISVVDNHGGIMGFVTEVTVGDDGKVHVDKVVGAIDPYNMVNPNLIAAQVEGGFIFGMTAALYGEITLKDGAVTQTNFNDYPLVGMAEAPRIEAHVCCSGGVDAQGRPRWGGVGECTVAPVAASITNSIFNATGKRIRRLPLKDQLQAPV